VLTSIREVAWEILRLPDSQQRFSNKVRCAMCRPEIRMNVKITALGAAVLIASLVFTTALPSQTSDLHAFGRVEGSGPTMAIGVAVSGIVSNVLVHEGDRVDAAQTLIQLDCRQIEAEVRTREARLAAAQATFDRYRNGSRPDEIGVGEAAVKYSQARADEAVKALERAEAMQEGVTVTTARVLEVRRDARIAAAQLEEARAKLSLLRAGSREEEIRHAEALRNAAAADLDAGRARLDQCTIRAPVDGVVHDVLTNPGQFLSFAVPQPLLHIVPDGTLRVRAEVNLRDLAHVCKSQSSVVSTDGFPHGGIHAEVASISPMASQRTIAAGAPQAEDSQVVVVTLEMERGSPSLPIGSVVTVHFDPCQSKS
jgi:multidrug resistance efflux pump